MRTRQERRITQAKELIKRMKICKSSHGYTDEDDEYIKRKRDIPHSMGSNFWNAYETKSMRNKQIRLKNRINIKNEIINN